MFSQKGINAEDLKTEMIHKFEMVRMKRQVINLLHRTYLSFFIDFALAAEGVEVTTAHS